MTFVFRRAHLSSPPIFTSSAATSTALEHPNAGCYTGQRIFVVRCDNYVYLVPFMEGEHSVFLKTIIPSRKTTKAYLGEESDYED